MSKTSAVTQSPSGMTTFRQQRDAPRLNARLLSLSRAHRRQAMVDMRRIVDEFEPLAMAMIHRHRVATAQTDVIGYFDLPAVPVGGDFVFAALPLDDGRTARWLVPIHVHRGAQKLTLSSANSAWPFTVVIPAD